MKISSNIESFAAKMSPQPLFTLPPKAQSKESRQVVALPLVLPAAAKTALLAVSMAAVASVGIEWNSLKKDEQRAIQQALFSSFKGFIEKIANGANINSFPRDMDGVKRVVMQEIAGNSEIPSLSDVLNTVQSLPVVGECQMKAPEDLIGMCGLCTSEAFQQLRKMGIKRVTQDPVENGAHYVVRILTKEGEYILDCTLGQFGGVNDPDSPWKAANLLKGAGNNNVVLVKKETYYELLKTHTRARRF